MSNTQARYGFLPWLRRGIAAKIKESDNFNDFSSSTTWSMERPEFQLRVDIKGKKGSTTGTESVNQNISLVGPGDILGIDKNVIIKCSPAHWVTDFGPNLFPYIEFYEEDFPWRYSPAKPVGDKLRPWVMLVVLKESEFAKEEGLTGPLPSMKVFPHETDATTDGALSTVWPDPSETWAWAHVHFNGDLDPTDNRDPNVTSDVNQVLNRFISQIADDPDRGISRIICPRKLEPNTNYHAFLVPSFEAGRLAGLGADAARLATVRAQDPAWGVAHAADVYKDRWPYYYTWFFKTGNAGDFESLVRRIIPRTADPKVGKRPMDVQTPGYGVGYTSTVPFSGTLLLEGALTATNDRENYPWLNSQLYRDRLADLLNLSEDLMEGTFPVASYYYTNNNPWGYSGASSISDDPIVTPDIYGRWHNLRKRVDSSFLSWLDELNLDPRNRAIAGLGAKYVKDNQDDLMDKAWEQLGDVLEANQAMRWGQFAAHVSHAGYAKNFAFQPEEQALAMTGTALKRIKTGSVTVYNKIDSSALPKAMESAAFRRVQRPHGPVMKRIDPNNTVFTQNNFRVSVGNQSMQVVAPHTASSQMAVTQGNQAASYLNNVISYPNQTAVFGISQPGGSMVPNISQQVAFQTALAPYQGILESNNWQTVQAAPPISVASVAATVVSAMEPRLTISRNIYALLSVNKPMTFPPPGRIVPVMAYPVFQKPMFDAVKELGVEYLIPNLDLIPNNSITLLKTNQRFIESFLVGANHELGRELLWREFPTDQRGSYFRQFWDSSDKVNTANQNEEDLANSILDITEIHTWNNKALGQNFARTDIADPDNLVLVIRGDLLKKYPNVVIYAQKAKWKAGDSLYQEQRELDTDAQPIYPVFGTTLEPDVHFLAFDLTADDARGSRTTGAPGWFFVLMERPGETQFGVDFAPVPAGSVNFDHWDDLHEDVAHYVNQHLSTTTPTNTPDVDNSITGDPSNLNLQVNWGENSTNFAQILYQNPVMVCIHAHEMLPNP